MLLKKSIGKAFNLVLLSRNKKMFSGVTKVLTEQDSITQNDIDSILGNEPSENTLQTIQEKERQLITGDLFYGLVPTKNDNYPPCIDPEEAHILETPNQNIMAALEMTVDNSYDDYCKALNKFWKEDQLYGSTSEPKMILPEHLEFKELLTTDSPFLEKLRGRFLVNLSMPGSIQAEDPRNFMELRPIQEFRNTPIIPIAESTMKKHKEKLEEYHRSQFVFQISKESIGNFLMFATAASVCVYMLYMLAEKEEEKTVAYTRFKYNRKMGIKDPNSSFRIS